MEKEPPVDYYETLQINANAEPETVHRVYRLLAQRFHPDNTESGNANRFRLITEAVRVLGTPEKRAQNDVAHQQIQKDRLAAGGEGGRNRHRLLGPSRPCA